MQMLLIVFFFPETAHPGSRGVDKAQGPPKLLVWVNPLRCLTFLRSPNIMAIVRNFYLVDVGTRAVT